MEKIVEALNAISGELTFIGIVLLFMLIFKDMGSHS